MKKLTNVPQKRPPIERMKYIAKLLRAGKKFTAATVARRLELNQKTIVRDIDFMRDRLHWDFAWDSATQTYRLLSAPKPQL